jgi:hypothetical protein
VSIEVQAAIAELEVVAAEIQVAVDAPDPESAEPDFEDTESEERPLDAAQADSAAFVLRAFDADVTRLLEESEATMALAATSPELVVVTATVPTRPTNAVRFREVRNPCELRMPADAFSTTTIGRRPVRRRAEGRRLDRAR